MAALGQLTVVVEAAERSGTLITADCAADIGRDVAAVPGCVTSDVAAGTNGLLRNGAALVTGPQDVLDLLYGVGAREVPSEPAQALDPVEADGPRACGARSEHRRSSRWRPAWPPAALRATLARLELRGLVRRAPSGSYVPAA